MKFKLDENLGDWAAAPLIADGHDVCTVANEGLCGKPDSEVLQAAVQEGRCLITLDIEFANPLVFPPKSHCGIAALRVARKTNKAEVLDLMRTLCQGLTNPSLGADSASDVHPIDRRVWIVQHGRIRVYQGHE